MPAAHDPSSPSHRAIEAVFRIEQARLIAGLFRYVRDVGRAEDLAQDALVLALERWPADGIPESPGAWLMAAAKNRAIDQIRRGKRLDERRARIGRGLEAREEGEAVAETLARDAALDDPVGDDLLRLLFISCHPILPTEQRVALTLRLLGGLGTDEIARAFLVPEATVAQRIVRAKKALAEANLPFEAPRGEEMRARLASVLEVVYLVFNEGYAATKGERWLRQELCEDAMRLGRILSGLVPDEPEAHGLLALMEIQASRSRARVGPSGEPVLLLEQNRAVWDGVLVRRGLEGLARGEALARGEPGPYLLQAALAACHARARTAEETDWRRIASLYAALARVAPSPVVELNRAVAVSYAEGPEAALAIVDRLRRDDALAEYHLLPSVRGDLLERLGRRAEARREFERAAGMTRNEREREVLKGRAEKCR